MSEQPVVEQLVSEEEKDLQTINPAGPAH